MMRKRPAMDVDAGYQQCDLGSYRLRSHVMFLLGRDPLIALARQTVYAIAREPAPSAETTGVCPCAVEGIVWFATIFRMSIHPRLLELSEEDSHLLVDQSAQRNPP